MKTSARKSVGRGFESRPPHNYKTAAQMAFLSVQTFAVRPGNGEKSGENPARPLLGRWCLTGFVGPMVTAELAVMPGAWRRSVACWVG